MTANFAEAVMIELTILDRYAVGAGGGYGVLNNPSGPLLQLRGAWFPLMSASATTARRRGLMIGADYRAYFAGDQIGTVSQFSGSLGYEK